MAKRSKKQGKRPRQEILLFIVEGESDKIALENPLNQFLDENGMDVDIRFCRLSRDQDGNEIDGGDSTSAFGIYKGNFDEEISERIMKDLTILDGIYPKYIVKVIQIADTDGVYIPDEQVIEDLWCEKAHYEDNCIKTCNVESIRKRNARKSEMFNHLATKNQIKLKTTMVDYSLYFFSCNIDHFLADNRNLEGYYKKSNASVFQGRCLDDSREFVSTFIDSEYVAKNMSYIESWRYIKEGSNSLSRFSNINLMIEDIIRWYNSRSVNDGTGTEGEE